MAQIVRPATQVLRQLALRERAELALEVADVGVVDVAVDDEGDRVAVLLPAKRVRCLDHGAEVVAPGPDQADDLGFAELVAVDGAVENGLHVGGRALRFGADPVEDRRRRRGFVAGTPVVGSGQAFAVDPVEYGAVQADIHPGVDVECEAWVDRQSFVQFLAGDGRLPGQFVQVWPGGFRVDEVRRQGGHAAPVVDSRGDDLAEHPGTQVGRRLDAHFTTEEDAGDGDGPQQFVEVGLRCALHLRAGLGPEVLHDDLLDVPVVLVNTTNREQRFDALAAGFADADEDARGERNLRLAGVGQGLEAHRRDLVRRTVVGHALLGQPVRCRLQHDAHGRRHRPQRGDLLRRHVAGVQVGQQARLVEHRLGGVVQVLQRGRVAVSGQPLAGGAIAEFGLLPQREESLLATHLGAVPCDLQDGVEFHVRVVELGGSLRESAVVADVAAQVRQGDEDFLGVGDEVQKALVAQGCGGVGERPRVGEVGERQGLGLGRYGALLGAAKNPVRAQFG